MLLVMASDRSDVVPARTGGSLLLRYAVRDLTRKPGVTLSLFALLVLCAFLMATGAMVIERLTGAVDRLFAEAKPPHFLQMHTGDYDRAALDAFAQRHPEIAAWTVVQLYGFDGAAIGWERPSSGLSGDLSESLIDNLFVTQNRDFDLLIDENGAIADPEPGEVFVPVAHRDSAGLQAGDLLRVRTEHGIHELTVRGFVRDAQMASSLSSATRFLVSDDDLRALGEGGDAPEIIVEYLLTDASAASQLQRDYEADDGLPRNGQAVTGDMIRLVHAFSDGLVAVALVFASILLVVIAQLNLRFVIRGTLQDGIREIGGLKAIGIPDRQISLLYLATYAVSACGACIVGGLLALAGSALLTQDLAARYASAAPGPASVLVPIAALAVVYAFVVSYCWWILRGIRRVGVVDALVHGTMSPPRRTARRTRWIVRRAAHRTDRTRRSSLLSAPWGGVGARLAVLELRAQWREWMLLPIVYVLATLLMVLPANLLTTFESPRFMAYLGAPPSDLRADVQFGDDIDDVRVDLLAAMGADERVSDVRVYAKTLGQIDGREGVESLRIEVGDQSGDTVDFVDGAAPEAGEIALSVLNADKHGVVVGERLDIRTGQDTGQDTGQHAAQRWNGYRVSGIYQDVTGGGHTAKLAGEVTEGAAGYVVYADVVDGADPAEVAAGYRELFPSVATIPMQEYLRQTLDHVTTAARSAAVLAFAFGVGVTLMITALFLGLRLSRDRRRMGVLSAIGFSTGEIVAQVRGKTLAMALTGIVAGTLIAAALGDALVGSLLSIAGLGLTRLSLVAQPGLVYVLFPLALLGAAALAAVLLTRRLRGADRSGWLA